LGQENPTDKSLVPLLSGLPEPAKAVSAVGKHTCAILKNDSKVKCWGANNDGQLSGVVSSTRNPNPSPVFNAAGSALLASSLTAGPRHTCVVLPDNTVNCWGDNSSGQLGNGTINATSTPEFVKVNGPGGDNLTGVIAISANGSDENDEASHTCALMSDGKVQCWGDGFFGQIGSNFKSVVSKPETVGGLFN